MITDVEPIHAANVACLVCKTGVAKTEATVAEEADCVMFFCGLDCYREWKSRSDSERTKQ